MSRIGVVVIGRNEGDRLIRCLASLPSAGVPIVYVDSGSTDDSVAQAEARGASVVRLDLSRPFTAGRARNEGFAALRTLAPAMEFVQFVDGDCELAPAWLATAQAFLDAQPAVAVVCGRRRERFPDRSIYNRLCDFEWDTPIGEAEACGGDALMRAAPLDAVGSYATHIVAGEEPELCGRLRTAGWTIWRIDAEMTLHDAAMTRFGQWWIRALRGGFAYAQVWHASRHGAHPVFGRGLARAILWGGAIPIGILLAAIVLPWALLAFGLYPVQVARIAAKRGAARRDNWRYAAFAVLAKFPECLGAARFFAALPRRAAHQAILYK